MVLSQGETGFMASRFDRMGRTGGDLTKRAGAKGERVRYLNRPRLPTGPATSKAARCQAARCQ